MDIANGRYDLVIENVTKSDEGIYTCSETSDPDTFTSTHLTVLGKPQFHRIRNSSVIGLAYKICSIATIRFLQRQYLSYVNIAMPE